MVTLTLTVKVLSRGLNRARLKELLVRAISRARSSAVDAVLARVTVR